MILQGLAPTMHDELTDMAGRRPACCVGFTIFIAANICLATQDSYVTSFLLQCLQRSRSSDTKDLRKVVAADISIHAERGIHIGNMASGPMVAPMLRPVLREISSQFLGWRPIPWFLTILTVITICIFLVVFPDRGRNVVANGSVQHQGWNISVTQLLTCTRIESSLKRVVSA